jgi:cytochrome c553
MRDSSAWLGAMLTIFAWTTSALSAEGTQSPSPRQIPGITAPDAFPGGCVDCHVVMPDGHDVRLSTLMTNMTAGVSPEMLAIAQGSMPAGVKLKGRHPEVEDSFEDIPAACLDCHGADSRKAPPFSRLLHAIHLGNRKDNHFLTVFQGECTHCHKLDAASGAMRLPSGPEK